MSSEPLPKEIRELIKDYGAEKIMKWLFKECDKDPPAYPGDYRWPMEIIMRMCNFHQEAFLKEIRARRDREQNKQLY